MLTPSLACSCVLTRTYPMAALVRSACGVCVCMQSVVNDFEDCEVERQRLGLAIQRHLAIPLERVGCDASNIWAVGDGGTVIHYNNP